MGHSVKNHRRLSGLIALLLLLILAFVLPTCTGQQRAAIGLGARVKNAFQRSRSASAAHSKLVERGGEFSFGSTKTGSWFGDIVDEVTVNVMVMVTMILVFLGSYLTA